MSMIAGYDYMDDVVREACNDLEDYHDHYWFTIYRNCVRCLEEMKIDIANRPTIKYLKVDQATKTVALPKDFINYISINIEYNGIMWALGYNPQMCRPVADDCGDTPLGEGGLINGLTYQPYLRGSEFDENGFEGQYLWGDWLWGDIAQKNYGHGGGYNNMGYYKVLHEDGIILLNPDFKYEHIILVYVSRGYAEGQKTLVPTMLKEAIILYGKWKFFETKMNTSANSNEIYVNRVKAENMKQQYWAKHRLSQNRIRNNSPYEIVAASRRANGPHVKQ